MGWAAPVDGQPFEITKPAPLLSEHTVEILAELGRSTDQIADLVDRKVV